MLRRLCLVATLLAACSDTMALELPEAGGRSYIAAFSELGTNAWTVAAQSFDQRVILTGVPSDAQVLVFVYAQDLATLGLEAGPIGSADMCARPCELLRPTGSFAKLVEGGSASGEPWKEASIPDVLASILVPDNARCESPCAEFRTTRINFNVLTRVAFTTRETDETALVMLQSGELVRVRKSGEYERVCMPAGGVTSGFGGPDAIWIAGSQGFGSIDVRFADRDAPCPVRPLPPIAGEIRWLDGGTSDRSFEAYALSATRAFSRFDGQRWSAITTLPLSERDRLQGMTTASRGTLRWLGPQRALAAVGGREVALVDPERGLQIEEISVDVEVTSPRVEASERSRAGQPILGLDDTGLVFPRGSSWYTPARSRTFDRIGFIIDLGPRIVFGSRSVLSQYVEGHGYCEDHVLALPVVPKAASRITSSDLVIGDLSSSDLPQAPTEVLWLEALDCAAQRER